MPRRRNVAEVVSAVLIGGWAIAVTVTIQLIAWVVEQVLIAEGLTMPAWVWPVAVWINAALVGVPTLILALLARRRTVRAAAWTATLAAFLLGVLGSLRGIPGEQNEVYLSALALAAALAAAALHAVSRRMRRPARRATGALATTPTGLLTAPPTGPFATTPTGLLATTFTDAAAEPTSGRTASAGRDRILLAAAAGIAILLPWLWVGALGSRLETGLAMLAAASIGWLCVELLGSWFRAAFAPVMGGRLPGGLAAGTAFVLLAAAIGGSGANLAELVLLPPLGFVAAVLIRGAADRIAIGLLIGAAVLGPLAFVEPDETSVVIGLHDVGYWALIGTLCSFVIAVAIAIAYLVADGTRTARGRTRPRTSGWRRAVAPAVLVAVTAAALVTYPAVGHPGFFGARLFVIMKTQADLTGLDQIKDLGERRRATYARLVEVAETTQASLRRTLRRDGLAYTPYYLVNGIAVDAGPDARIWLSRRSDVDRVLRNPRLRPIPSAGGPIRGNRPGPSGPEWNISMINADEVWATGDTGTGIVIGGSDTGVDVNHPALASSYRGGDDSWFDPWNHTRTPVDHNGHGTHTMGSALGTGGIGVAPGAKWMSCVNLDRNMGNPAYYLDCLQFMLAPFPYGGDPFRDGRPDRAADVLTNSWGCPPLEGCDASALRPAVAALTAAGIFFVAAAGNEGPRCSSIDDVPAAYPDTFTVGAVDRDNVVADFSSRGPTRGPDRGVTKPDVVAPGVDVVSALPGGGYGRLDGTSMATPQVAGVVALMWSASPALRGDIARTAKILRDTATIASPSAEVVGGGSCGDADQTGAGLIDAAAAVQAGRRR